MSIPAWARTRSTAAGRPKARHAWVAKDPPALGRGTTHTGSYPYRAAQSSSTINARFKCSQHWAASQIPRSRRTG